MNEFAPSIFDTNQLNRLKQELVVGLNILDDQGQGCDIAGHVTARLPRANTFWTNEFFLGFEEASISSLNELDLKLNIVSGSKNISPAISLHAEIYKKNPEVNAVVHTHPTNAVALSTIEEFQKIELLNIDQQAAPFFNSTKFYSEHDGVFANGEGRVEKVADHIVGSRALILANHGIIVTGENIREAIVGAIILEKACEIQLKAMSTITIDKNIYDKLKILPKDAAFQAKKELSKKEIFDYRFNYFARIALKKNVDLAKRAAI